MIELTNLIALYQVNKSIILLPVKFMVLECKLCGWGVSQATFSAL